MNNTSDTPSLIYMSISRSTVRLASEGAEEDEACLILQHIAHWAVAYPRHQPTAALGAFLA